LCCLEPGLLKALRRLASNGKLKQKKLAIATYTNLQAYTDKVTGEDDNVSNGREQQQLTPNLSECTTTPHNSGTTTTTSNFSTSKSGAGLVDTFRPSIASAHTYILFVSGLKDEKTKKMISDCLLTTKGVVSFIIDLLEQKVVVRTITSVDTITQAIFSNTGMRASIKEHSSGHSTTDCQEDNKENYPDYLPEVKRDPRQQQNSNNRGWFGLGAIISFSDAKKEQKQKETSSGWLSKLGKALNII
jgi:hypothetical protein